MQTERESIGRRNDLRRISLSDGVQWHLGRAVSSVEQFVESIAISHSCRLYASLGRCAFGLFIQPKYFAKDGHRSLLSYRHISRRKNLAILLDLLWEPIYTINPTTVQTRVFYLLCKWPGDHIPLRVTTTVMKRRRITNELSVRPTKLCCCFLKKIFLNQSIRTFARSAAKVSFESGGAELLPK